MATKRPGPGRPPKGQRTQLTMRIPSAVYEAIRAEAKARGISMNDYLVHVAASDLGMPVSQRVDEEALSA